MSIGAVVVTIYNLTLIIGTVYLIQVCGWSNWTFLGTLCFMMEYGKKS